MLQGSVVPGLGTKAETAKGIVSGWRTLVLNMGAAAWYNIVYTSTVTEQFDIL